MAECLVADCYPTNTIMSLIDNCINIIFTKLELRDKVSLACTNSRFAKCFISSNGVRYEYDLKTIVDDLHFNEQQSFFAHVGSYLEEFTILGRIKQPHFDLIFEVCVNMTSLVVHAVTLSNIDTNENTPVLTHLNLLASPVTDNHIRALKHFGKLRSLTIIISNSITGQYINKLTTLKNLSLTGCSKLNPCYVVEFIKSLVDLRTLSVDFSDSDITKEICHYLVQYSHELKALQLLARSTNLEILANLPALKHLATYNNNNPTRLLHELATKKANQLESLKVGSIRHPIDLKNISCLKKLRTLQCRLFLQYDEIVDSWSAMDNLEELTLLSSPMKTHCVLYILKRCKNLRTLCMEGFREIDSNFLLDAITLLRRMKIKNRRNSPILFVCKTAYTDIRDVEKEYKQAEKEGILTLKLIR